jgi:CCR4-NOT transcription complex subunit 7/8
MLPISEAEFRNNIKLYFPVLYDIKYLMLFTDGLVGGLQNVANYLAVERIGTQHQAGSDSLLTGQVFFRMYQQHFPDGLSDVKYSGHIAGFKSSVPSSALSLQAKKDLEDAALCAELEELQTGMSSPMRDH